jgi:hypothetical protein
MALEHPEIPTGSYCYKVVEVSSTIDGKPVIKTETCPHWQKIDKGARCNLLKEDHYAQCPFHLVWDQVKECGINLDRDYPPESQEEYRARLIKEGFELRNLTCKCGRDTQIWEKKKNGD